MLVKTPTWAVVIHVGENTNMGCGGIDVGENTNMGYNDLFEICD
jgi:hypothetical protein